MKIQSNTVDAFFALLRAGLWEEKVRLLSSTAELDFDAIFNLASEQSVVGLIAAGLEQVEDMKMTKMQAMPFLKSVVAIEGRNVEMNMIISRLITQLEEENIVPVLVKGQGVAGCYERPLWRFAGDIDLLLDREDYEKAKMVLSQIAQDKHSERKTKMHIGMTISSVELELHGTLHTGLSRRMDSVVDSTQEEMFQNRQFREWNNHDTPVLLPASNYDVIFIFTHILQHFFKGGIGLRQICDWCRLLWTYRAEIDRALLEQRLRKMGLIREWRAFAAVAVEYLGMPITAMPLYENVQSQISRRIVDFILEFGSLAQNQDNSYQRKHLPVVIRRFITLWRHLKDNARLFRIFPGNSFRFLIGYFHAQLED